MKGSGLGWAPEMPVSWTLVRAKYLLKKLDRSFKAEDAALICTNKGKVIERGETNYGLVSSDEMNYQGVHPGDLLIHGMDTWHGAIAISELGGKCTTVVHVCDSDQDKRFLCYYYQSLAFQNVYKLISNGIRQNTSDFRSFSKFGEIPTFVPPLEEQQRIADYLDERCLVIDTAKQTLSDEVEALQRLRKATIHKAVTKGLDDNVPMRDSGVEWIGEIPETWGVEPLRQFFIERKHKNKNGKENNLLSLSYGRVVRRSIDATDGLLPANFLGYNIVERNDLVLRMTDLQNDQKSLRSGLVTERGIITSAYIALAPKAGVESRYHNYLQRAYDQLKVYYNMGGGVRQGVNYDVLKRIPVLVPPISEQQRIADYLDERCAAIDSIIGTRTKQIERLDDYRKALVFAYVTGKKEVPVA